MTHHRGESTLRREADTTGDGRLDTVDTYENGKLRRQVRDGDLDGTPDVLVEYGKTGEREREELGPSW